MSQIEADRLELHPVEIELPGLARTCLDVVRPAAEAKGLALVLAPAAPLRLFADPTRLRQVLINLLGNAIKFTPTGAVEVRLRQIKDGAFVRLEVADTGPGIRLGTATNCSRHSSGSTPKRSAGSKAPVWASPSRRGLCS
jgi:signal transduction histidine kinase